MRLNKYISNSGYCSRREADELILSGRVLVNGRRPTIGQQVTEDDEISIDNSVLKPQEDLVYYALNKPKGVISTASDEKGRKSVVDLVPKTPKVYPVGRLDANSEGLIILTNDGELTNELTHPSREHQKEYIVKVGTYKRQPIDAKSIENQFKQGVRVEGKLMKADDIKINPLGEGKYLFDIILHTGYNRQIRKMCDKMKLEVLSLKRVRIEKITLSELNIASGECKKITKNSIL